MLSYLKKQGWVNYLRAGLGHSAAGFDFAKITVDLAPEGLRELIPHRPSRFAKLS